MEQLAQNALMNVENLAEKLGVAESVLEAGYAQFADALLVVQDGRYWQPTFPSWGKYLASITEKYKMGQRQLYHKVAVVKELRGSVSMEDLTSLGISKASVLADAHRLNGGVLPEGALEQAKIAVTAKDLKQSLAESLHLPAEELGGWMDLNFAFIVTDEERATFLEAERIARAIDPPISVSLVDHQQKKNVALRWAIEFIASYPVAESEVL